MHPSAEWLENVYEKYNRRKYVRPDPIEFLYRYPDVRDREIAALIASSLAYGRVSRILHSIETVLDRMRSPPRQFVEESSDREMASVFSGFKHRFTAGRDIAALLKSVKSAVKVRGSLNACFLSGFDPSHDTVLPALDGFVRALGCGGHLLPCPSAGSACKRLNLFLRWMVRQDRVDPGGWTGISPEKLIVPLDVHMTRIGRSFGFTSRKAVGMRMAMEVTAGFRKLRPDDPVRYDFALTRFGIHPDLKRSPA